MNLSIKNFLMVGVMAMAFIILAKVIVNKYGVLEPIQAPVNAV
jgi:hypothetical protein